MGFCENADKKDSKCVCVCVCVCVWCVCMCVCVQSPEKFWYFSCEHSTNMAKNSKKKTISKREII